MITALAFVAAAAAGSLLRAEAGRWGDRPGALPWGTLAVNVGGAFLLGLLDGVGPPALTVLGVGGLGALTTFSTFGRQLVTAVELRRRALAATYLATTLLAGIAAAAAGLAIA